MNSSRFLHQFASPTDDRFDVVIDDNGRACYAYLRHANRIVGDVWLYNTAEAPEVPEWTLPDARQRMPFLNPRAYCTSVNPSPLRSAQGITVEWSGAESSESRVRVIVHGSVWAVLQAGSKPGWCRFAAHPGPLAKPLAEIVEGAMS